MIVIAPAEEVVRGITLIFFLLKYPCYDENGVIVGGYEYHGQTRGVRTWVVGCALASLLGMECEQYCIQKCLDIIYKNSILYSILHTPNTPKFAQIPFQNGVFEM